MGDLIRPDNVALRIYVFKLANHEISTLEILSYKSSTIFHARCIEGDYYMLPGISTGISTNECDNERKIKHWTKSDILKTSSILYIEKQNCHKIFFF